MGKPSYVYILASRPYGTLYIGVTSDLLKRIWQHRTSATDGFTTHHDVKRLFWYEIHTDIRAAIIREKQRKKWNCDWKINLIQSGNAHWHDLYEKICG